MASPTIHTLPSIPPTPILTSGPYLIVSTDAAAAGIGRLAFGVNGFPPSGGVTLQPSVGDPLSTPTLLWFPIAVSARVFQIICYISVGATKPLALQGGNATQPVTVANLDPTNAGQLWELVDLPNDGSTSVSTAYVMQNCGANGAAIKRSTVYPVPNTSLVLGTPADGDSHSLPYYYEFVKVGGAPVDTPPHVSHSKSSAPEVPVVQQVPNVP
jgi:hypothetical protein